MLLHPAGFVAIPREWFDDGDKFFAHEPISRGIMVWLVVAANWKDGYRCRRGQLLTSLAHIACRTGFSVQQVRTALVKLEKHGFINNQSNKQGPSPGRLITVCNYDSIVGVPDDVDQPANKEGNKQPTSKQQASNKQPTSKQQHREQSNNPTIQQGEHTKASSPPLFEEEPQEVQAPPPKKKAALPGEDTKTGKTWRAYHFAYVRRYGQEPIWNGRTAGITANLVACLGEELAPKVIEFYVGHGEAFYVRNAHAIQYALRDAEKLATEYRAGVQITSGMARNSDLLTNNRQAAQAALTLLQNTNRGA